MRERERERERESSYRSENRIVMSREVGERTRSWRWWRRDSDTVVSRGRAWLLHKTSLKCPHLHTVCYGFFFFSSLVHFCFRRSHGRRRLEREKEERKKRGCECDSARGKGMCDEDDVCVWEREKRERETEREIERERVKIQGMFCLPSLKRTW